MLQNGDQIRKMYTLGHCNKDISAQKVKKIHENRS